jgi:anti-anti-sigma regulatory factor
LCGRDATVARRAEFRLESVPRQVRRVLEMCNLLDLFGVSTRQYRSAARIRGSGQTRGLGGCR